MQLVGYDGVKSAGLYSCSPIPEGRKGAQFQLGRGGCLWVLYMYHIGTSPV